MFMLTYSEAWLCLLQCGSELVQRCVRFAFESVEQSSKRNDFDGFRFILIDKRQIIWNGLAVRLDARFCKPAKKFMRVVFRMPFSDQLDANGFFSGSPYSCRVSI